MEAILQYIDDTYFKEGYVPTCREIAEALGISTSNTYRNVKFFEDKRLLTTTTKGNSVTTTRMRDMFYDEIAIQGVAVKVIKDLEE